MASSDTRRRRVLVLYYSQTGQLGGAVAALVAGLDPQRFAVTTRAIRPLPDYPFPWSVRRFFGVFPDCVLGNLPAIEPLKLDDDAPYDLIVLGVTVWYLAPSLPIQAFLADEQARVLRDTPVTTVIACRNMWHNASEQLKLAIADRGGLHIDNVVVTDQGPAWATFVTTPRWMFTGKREAFGVFPAAGVADETIEGMRRFGEAISARPEALDARPPAPLLRGLGAVSVEQRYIVPELIGKYSFPPWAHLIALARRLGVVFAAAMTMLFVVYLVLAILVLVPLSILVRLLLYPLMRGWYHSHVKRLISPTETDPRSS